MKIAVISDIHGNYPALKEVFRDITNQNIDLILCSGDLVGYGAFPRPSPVYTQIFPDSIGTYPEYPQLIHKSPTFFPQPSYRSSLWSRNTH